MKDDELSNGQLAIVENLFPVQRVNVTEEASSPTLVFLHDALGSITQWGSFPMKLAMRCKLNAIVYDRAGHGSSRPLFQTRNQDYLHREALEVLPELLQQLDVQYPILIGHSDGGTIALIYAAYYQPTAIITEAAHVFVEAVTLEGIRAALGRKANLIAKITPYHGDKTEALFNAWADTWLDEHFIDWSIEALLPRISCPALAIQGRNDQYGSEEQIARIENGIGPNAASFWIENGGHIPHRQAEEAVLDEMTAFIKKVLRATITGLWA